MNTQNGPKLSISLYCFSAEIHSGTFSIADSIEKVAELGAEAVEIVNTQHIEGFPHPSAEFIKMFRDAVEANQLKLSSYGTYSDTGIRTNGRLTLDEIRDQLLLDLKLAESMGFPLIRVGPNTPPPVISMVLPTAEKMKIKLGIEIHAPLSSEHPMFIQLLDTVKQSSSEYLGFVPDFSCWTTGIPNSIVEYFISQGLPEAPIRHVANGFNTGVSLQAIKGQLHAMGVPPEADDLIDMIYHIVIISPPENLAAIMPYVNHIHGKFWRMENGVEPGIPYDNLIKVVRDSGYSGYVSSEFEGYMLGIPGVEQTKEHQNMLRGYLGYPLI